LGRAQATGIHTFILHESTLKETLNTPCELLGGYHLSGEEIVGVALIGINY